MTASDWKRRFEQWQESKELLHVLPEVAALVGVPQAVEYHAEGDALTHTLLAVAAVDAGADERVFWAVLLHDIGKPVLWYNFLDKSQWWSKEKLQEYYKTPNEQLSQLIERDLDMWL